MCVYVCRCVNVNANVAKSVNYIMIDMKAPLTGNLLAIVIGLDKVSLINVLEYYYMYIVW